MFKNLQDARCHKETQSIAKDTQSIDKETQSIDKDKETQSIASLR